LGKIRLPCQEEPEKINKLTKEGKETSFMPLKDHQGNEIQIAAGAFKLSTNLA
jgi:hypothetical protein